MKSIHVVLVACVGLILSSCDTIFPTNPTSSTAQTGSVQGRALYDGQTDSSGIVISLEALDTRGQAGTVAARTVTVGSGSYSLSGLAPGNYSLYAASPDSLQGAVAIGITITAGRVLTAADLTLTPTGSITGSVTLKGSPLQGLLAYLAGTSFSARTKADGTYTISGVPSGTDYTLVGHQDGYLDVSQVVSVGVGTSTAAEPLDVVALAPNPAADDSVTLEALASGQLYGSSRVDASVHQPRNVRLDATLPAGGAAVYYLLTNTSRYTDRPLAEVDLAAHRGLGVPNPKAEKKVTGRKILRDLPDGDARGQAAWSRALESPSSRGLAISPVPKKSKVGDKTVFIDALWEDYPTEANDHPSTLRTRVAEGSRVLNVWVADDAWDATGSGSPAVPATGLTHGVSQAMVDALADKFLNATKNDIYHWVTGLFGKEWPSSGAPTGLDGLLIDSGGQVNIFLINLNPGGTDEGVLMGYFHSLNNLLNVPGSNEKVLFAVDADSLANPDDAEHPTVWSLTDFWPAEIVSTLAHEFQHMIHFYQKQVKHMNPVETDAWINEMASMVTEDLVADKLGVPGPRGVQADDYSAGASGNPEGRFPLFNYWHESIPLTRWGDGPGVLMNYSSSYAFGAWLIRNYGGAALFRDIVTSNDTDYHAVVNAVRHTEAGANQTWESLVRDWGVATFLGTDAARAGLNFGTPGGKYQWTVNTSTYSTGSINPWNYRYYLGSAAAYVDGPYVYGITEPLSYWSSVAAGQTYFQSAGVLSGSLHTTLSLPADVSVSVVAIPLP